MPPYLVFHLLSSYDGKSSVAKEHYWLNGALQGTPDWRYKSAVTWGEFDAVRRKNPVADLWLIGLRLSEGYIKLNRDGYAQMRVKSPKVCLLLPDDVVNVAQEVKACDADTGIKLSSLPRDEDLVQRNREIRGLLEKMLVPTEVLRHQGPR